MKSLVSIFGLVLAVSEIGLALFKRAGGRGSTAADRGSLRLLWLVILLCIGAAYAAAGLAPSLGFGLGAGVGFGLREAVGFRPDSLLSGAAIALFVAGLSLRWYSIIHLGKYFTVNLAIAEHQRVIDTGPYRYIRHPSYTGILMEFTAMGIAFFNWGSLAAMTVPIIAAFLWRMRIEEEALTRGLGREYLDYIRRTKRLIPAVY